MELAERGTVRDELDRNPGMSSWERFQILRDVVRAMSTIHSRGALHRDIKTTNLFVMEDGKVKVGDFGLATGLATSSIGNTEASGPLEGGQVGRSH